MTDSSKLSTRPLDRFVNSVREQAEREAFEAEKARIARRREHEKWMRARGHGGRYDDIVLRDLESFEKAGRLEFLREDPAFVARERFLIEEREGAIARAKEKGEEAGLLAASNPPPDVALEERHFREQTAFMAQNRILEVETMPGALRKTWDAMRARHEIEKREHVGTEK